MNKRISITILFAVIMLTSCFAASKLIDRQLNSIKTNAVFFQEVFGDELEDRFALQHSPSGELLIPLAEFLRTVNGSLSFSDNYYLLHYKNRELAFHPDMAKAFINGYEIDSYPQAFEQNDELFVTPDWIYHFLGIDIVFDRTDDDILIKPANPSLPAVFSNTITYIDDQCVFVCQTPVVVGLIDKNYEKSLNSAFTQEASERKNTFLLDAKNNRSYKKYTCSIEIQPKLLTESTLSILLREITYNGGSGAESSLSAYNINLDMQKQIFLTDIIKNNADIFQNDLSIGMISGFYLEQERLSFILPDSTVIPYSWADLSAGLKEGYLWLAR